MSCLQYLTRIRASLVTRRYLHLPSVAHNYRRDDADAKRKNASPSLPRTSPFLPQTRFQNFRSDFAGLPHLGASFRRSMSTANGDSGDSGVADLVSENANEVAVAAADSLFPISLAQHFIDAVHSYTGFNWWSSIVVAAFIQRGLILPPFYLYSKSSEFLVRRDNADKAKELRERLTRTGQELRKLKGYNVKNVVEYASILTEGFILYFRPLMASYSVVLFHATLAMRVITSN